MNSQSFCFFSLLTLASSLVLIHVPQGSSNPNEFYQPCGKKYTCGNITGLSYPFLSVNDPPFCGYPGFEFKCNQDSTTTMVINNINYRILNVHPTTQTMRVVREDMMESPCPVDLVNTTLDYSLFDFAAGYTNLTFLYNCPVSYIEIMDVTACRNSKYHNVFVLPGAVGPGKCTASVTVPVLQTSAVTVGSLNSSGLGQLLQEGFDIRWKLDGKACSECTQKKGRCGYDEFSKKTTCFCPGPPLESSACSAAAFAYPPPFSISVPSPSPGNAKKSQTPLTVGLSVGGAVLAGIGVGWLIFFCRQRKKQIASEASPAQTERKDLPILSSSNGLTSSSSSPSSTNFTRSIPSYPSSKSEADYGRGSSYFGAHVFSFAELEEATNNFDQSKELGDGGFGVVYFGKLQDGRKIAVKRLYENNFKRVEQFMNEVEILTKLRHKNLVTLYGCTSKRSRDLLLVYEYIPNGTVADHLHGKRAKSGLLSWPVRMNIAIETADALAYLHSSVIIHRDVKTNNILLDNDFHVKVADFGLSRLFPNNVTHVSTAPQGTPGYVDPEYYQCYHLTEKSDVYSFGVVLVELISSLEAVDTDRHRHDINLANMAVNKIQSHSMHELVDPNLGFSTNSSVRRMTTLVAELAFRCLQQERDLRPSMQEVLETLRGIQDGESKAHKAEVLDIVVDDVGLLKGSCSSPDSVAPNK
ncbi:LEAF RUST 10 DISEASE-RESISTANCE LOCUS RECEPTOR-LIKE PROTEIN KINASE-like 1.4 isoform X2 [Capsicum annuum]|uniref:LEAF RUST 10 DISEASE-RESISTANCE LOCUS RECEPTOR-LIKE PROTEIN KINASE-like 1.4 isoform X2 n=1 Tax=Capsicum annuum TaxID=4072 RepID=UPI001FB0F06D|nr:LEAF RUST 10 DISEASE-RESISTANCE LOCUS RECEPTOR-LIKE PROTEIN KINASE-like 1.4 isoform X2 [Capsicum annuum]